MCSDRSRSVVTWWDPVAGGGDSPGVRRNVFENDGQICSPDCGNDSEGMYICKNLPNCTH